MKLDVSLPEFRVEATISLYEDGAPTVSRAVHDSLAKPLETRTAHACFDGHAVYCYLRDFPEPPPVENSTMHPIHGDVMFYYAPARAFSWLNQDQGRMSPAGTDADVYEFSFIYGQVNLMHVMGESFHGSLIGRVTTGFEELADAFRQTLAEGCTPLVLRQGAAD